ncbi:retrovirus-related pol polyprotein from transposon TNT 1-94 [Tanacetum coccineum]|uniref:Retrovirus-related pol polyprotein from transposon TNT 1-94 n=1 Tax=Tanacetum coccineum TaxID=301880 RepID=A0ABQ5EPC9_9ASTR
MEISDLNASLQEKVLEITALKDDLRKLKGKALVDNVVMTHTIDPEILKIDELLTHIGKTCPSINNTDGKIVAVIPKNKDKRVRFTEPVTSSGNTITKTTFTSNLVSNKPMLSSTGVKPSTSVSGSQPSGNIKKGKIRQTPSSTQKNKVEAHPRKVKSSLKNKDCVVQPKGTAHVQHSKLNANSELKCVKCNGCMLSDNHDVCVLDFINNVNAHKKSKSVNKRNACPLTMITTTTKVPLRKPTALENETPKPIVTLVYSRKPRKSKTNVPISKSKVLKYVSTNKKEPSPSWGSIVFDVPSSSLDECRSSKLFSVKFGNDRVAKILGYGDYQIGNVTISSVYYVEGLRHNLFSVGQFYDSNLEVDFCQHTCFICDLEGVDLLTGSRGNNLYTLSLRDMMVKFLRTKDEAPDFIIKFLKMIQVRLKVTVQRIRIDNGTEFVNQTLREYYEKIGISHETSVARSPQQNGVVEKRNHTLIEASRTMLIYAKAPLFLSTEAVATACYTQNRFIVRLRHDKTPYELLHDKPPDLSFFHVFGTLCYPTNDGENLDESSKQFMTRANPLPSTPFVPPSRTDWNILFQPLFDELLTPSPSVDLSAPEVIAPITKVVTPVHVVLTGSPSSTTVDQDAPSPSNSQTTPETQPPLIPNDVEEYNHDIEVAYMGNDPYFDQFPQAINMRQALLLLYDAFLTTVETQTCKDALTQSAGSKQCKKSSMIRTPLNMGAHNPDRQSYGYLLLKWILQSEARRTGGILKNKASINGSWITVRRGKRFLKSLLLQLQIEAIRIFPQRLPLTINTMSYQMDVKLRSECNLRERG